MVSSNLLKKQKERHYYENDYRDAFNNSSKNNFEYDIVSPKTSKRIIDVLEGFDIYENKKSSDCYPDYKFPEIRWGDENEKSENPDLMSNEEIKNKFQLLSKEIKQRKKVVCMRCYQSGNRSTAFNIPFFYKGNEKWDENIPKKGKDAELGCIGCAWYDFAEWRKHLLYVLEK